MRREKLTESRGKIQAYTNCSYLVSSRIREISVHGLIIDKLLQQLAETDTDMADQLSNEMGSITRILLELLNDVSTVNAVVESEYAKMH